MTLLKNALKISTLAAALLHVGAGASACQKDVRDLHAGTQEFGRYAYMDSIHRVSGIDVDVFREIARRLGCYAQVEKIGRDEVGNITEMNPSGTLASAQGPRRIARTPKGYVDERDLDPKEKAKEDNDNLRVFARKIQAINDAKRAEMQAIKVGPGAEAAQALLKMVESGEVDVVGHQLMSDAASKVAWMVPYMNVKNVAIINKRVNINTSKPDDFIDHKTAKLGLDPELTQGHGLSYLVWRLNMKDRVVTVSDNSKLFGALRAGSVDAVISTSLVFSEYLVPRDLNQFDIVDWYPSNPMTPMHLMLSKKIFSEAASMRVRQIVNEMILDNSMHAIVLKHLGRRFTPTVSFPSAQEQSKVEIKRPYSEIF
jgi:ABC-type amino acid transport substrate-binding protein